MQKLSILKRRKFSDHPEDKHLSFALVKNNYTGEYVSFLVNDGALYEGHYFQDYKKAEKDFYSRE